jgi:undecaprenyl-diphosphatase
MDRWLFEMQNSWAGWGSPLDYLAWVLGVHGITLLIILLALRWFSSVHPWDREQVLLVLIGAIFAAGLAQLPMVFYYRERPFMALPDAFNLLGDRPSPSFPSSHATVAFLMAILMGWNRPLWGLLAWIAAVGTAWARVYGGVHYPSDMLGAILLALPLGLLTMALRTELTPLLRRLRNLLPGEKDPNEDTLHDN